jgi:hypothetical protein
MPPTSVPIALDFVNDEEGEVEEEEEEEEEE